MKKFHNEKEILESNLSVPIKRVLHQHLLEICNIYEIDDISTFGSICYIESSTDLETLDLSVIEWSIGIEIINDNKKQQLFYFCILIDNDTGLNILVDEKHLKYKNHFIPFFNIYGRIEVTFQLLCLYNLYL